VSNLIPGQQGEQPHLSAAQRYLEPVSGEERHLHLQGLQSKVLHHPEGKKESTTIKFKKCYSILCLCSSVISICNAG